MDSLGPPASLELLGDISTIAPNAPEFVPVDNFFDSYIAELSSRSKRTHEPTGDNPVSKAPKFDTVQTAGATHLAVPAAYAGMAGSMQPQFMEAALGGAVQPTMHMLPGMQGSGGTTGIFGAAPAPYAGLGLQLGGGYPVGPSAALLSSGPAVQPADSHGTSQGNSHGDSKVRKSAKQQEANKVAQQRYRDRKKQKYQEMEAQVGVLSQQLAALQALQGRNQLLEGLNSELHSQLIGREKEVERLKLALDIAAERSLSSHSHPPSPTAAVPQGDPADNASQAVLACGSCDLLPEDLTGIDFKQGFADEILKLRSFVEQHGVTDGAAPGHSLSDSDMRALGQLVARSCQLCQAALRAEGVRVIELINKDPGSLSLVGSAAASERWTRCLEVMHLSQQQQEVLLLNRRSHLQRMRCIYLERQGLNMQAMSLMLPHSSPNPAEDNTVEGRMANMSSAGYLQVAKSSAELGEVLDRIKDNLRREQRAVMELNCLLIAKLLNPLQAAHYMLTAYPQHCDALALSNMLAKRLGREEYGDSPPTEGAAALAGGGCQQQVGCC
ncbi:hypothetical protein ACK3TF_000063 [Chlorella vulgaris]